MSNAEQQARELAEKCAKEISTCPETIVVLTRVILRELNLVALLEAQSELKRLEGEILELAFQLSQRTAITNAMREQEEAK